ncbi:NAD(P)/FAD-dependent oxidoreductase [Nocardia terpenica]|uniref:phytoene desaturase family protein n=1 Tax=Nocardia terpenica TaxID=455432 RepID=UPI001892DC2A|nr:NAD(P)/FAD-dependent oxidoreductase [Nocardia terpenica]MBF6063152.1 NAD(P)/FAD-dependent oxidoreductase [Nocardia terpenica]MBF6105708.1 NAD(P)/FAD-dependent oxidoreductase [Nocardia terpenica]MBF6113708.1 NAD(P)/FAD-dependent oxidoreductase [Nocardia terpenica]MBF6119449.1 NAD(P)/FAD-dependent oxidoreductase [Nocardia terpenica]MBF6151860.1 NAD(P)/FAD-dependent oxidoreductase [Nocardia terpenica]
MTDAVVVGSGPNGLAAAVILARAGLEVEVHEAADTVGGGCRTAELTLPGYHHDVCAGAHPMALASPFFRAFDLAAHGVEMLVPEVSYAHPLDGGVAALAWRDLERTAAGLGRDGGAWRRLFGPIVRHWEAAVDLAMSDMRHPPLGDPLTAVRFGRRVLEQASPLWNLRFRDELAPALFTGVSAHAIVAPPAFSASGVAMLLGALAHAGGWPVARGGSQAIVDALAAEVEARGGRIVTGHRVDSLDEFRGARTVLFDTAPAELLRVADARLPRRYARSLGRYRYGGAACKVDFALSGPVPWQASGCERAGTLHLIGTRAEAAAAEKAVAAGRFAERPYVLTIQPGVVDATRAPEGGHTLYTYAHVPHGSTRDVSDAVIAQIERFAPGFRDLILATHVRTASAMPAYNANYVGGDISAGAMTLRQTVFRPTPRWNPYATPLRGVYLCSSATSPGPGVHGMSGLHAAHHTLRTDFGIPTHPLDLLRSVPIR